MIFAARLSFACAAALVGAVIGDAMLEATSNSMILWHGRYTDQSSLDLVPASLLALVALAIVIGVVVRRELQSGRTTDRRLMFSALRLFGARQVWRMAPAILALQLVVLFCMETIEQIVAYGHPLGGTIWMGAPVAVSIAVHALLALACSQVLSRAIGSCAAACTRIVRHILGLRLPRVTVPCIVASDASFGAARLLLVTELGVRGPPRR